MCLARIWAPVNSGPPTRSHRHANCKLQLSPNYYGLIKVKRQLIESPLSVHVSRWHKSGGGPGKGAVDQA